MLIFILKILEIIHILVIDNCFVSDRVYKLKDYSVLELLANITKFVNESNIKATISITGL
jgi:hypothetical protein